MEERHGTSHFDMQHDPSYRMMIIDEARYHSARWWRNLNRGMSVVGILVIGAVIALIVLGVRQQWT